MPAIRFQLFGRADLTGPPSVNPGAVLARPKLVALLSYLVAAKPAGPHRRDTLVGLLWSEANQGHARGALRQSLYHLRRFLGSDILITRGDEVVGLNAQRLSSDVAHFEDALARHAREEAVEVYRGAILEGFHLSDAPAFERWLDQRRDELQQGACRAAWELALEAVSGGTPTAAARWARQALHLASQDEALLRQVVELLDRVGDRAGAIREYDVFAKLLREEFEVEPSPETKALMAAIRSGRPPWTAAAARDADAGAARSALEMPVAGRETESHVPGTSAGPTSIAVLPFVNMSGDPEDEYLGDGLAEEITSALARARALQVASRTSAFAFKGRRADARRIGRDLGVATILEGSVRKAGGRIRITAQLINAEDGYHLWSEKFDRGSEDILSIQDEIARSVVSVLQVILTDRERRALTRPAPSDMEAYEYYLRGRHYLRQERRRSLEYARNMFTRAVTIDPEFALAYAGIADCCSLLHLYYPSADAALEQGEEASRRAVELDPSLPESHTARGFTLSQQSRFDEAEVELRTAIRLDDGQFEARYYLGRQCFRRGRFSEAARWFEDAAAVREDCQARFFAAQSYEALGEQSRALESYGRALEVARHHLELYPDDPRAATMRAVASCRTGQREEGLHWAEQALAIDPEDAGVRYNVACFYALEGEEDRAIDVLEECLKLGFGNLDWVANDPDLASLKDDPRFRKLIEPGRRGPQERHPGV